MMEQPPPEPERGPGGLKQEVWFGIIGGAVIVVLLAVVAGVFISNAMSDAVEEPAAQEVKIAEPEEPGLKMGPSKDAVKEAIMKAASDAGWEYEWKEARSTDIYEANDVVFSRKNSRIGLIVYWSENDEYLDSVETGTEDPDVAMRYKGALLVFSPMPGTKVSQKLLDAFRD